MSHTSMPGLDGVSSSTNETPSKSGHGPAVGTSRTTTSMCSATNFLVRKYPSPGSTTVSPVRSSSRSTVETAAMPEGNSTHSPPSSSPSADSSARHVGLPDRP